MLAVVGGLNHFAIRRLSQTWSKTDKGLKEVGNLWRREGGKGKRGREGGGKGRRGREERVGKDDGKTVGSGEERERRETLGPASCGH